MPRCARYPAIRRASSNVNCELNCRRYVEVGTRYIEGVVCERGASSRIDAALFLHFLHPPCALITIHRREMPTLASVERSSTMKARVGPLLIAIAVALPLFAQRSRPSAPAPAPPQPQPQVNLGAPLRGLSASDLAKFNDGRT